LIADSMAGHSGRCPICREIVHVPASAPQKNTPPPLPTPQVPSDPAAPSLAPSTAASAQPATADTVLMPLTLEEIAATATPPPLPGIEPDYPVMAEPDLMAQTLPLPTAELIPKENARPDEAVPQINFDTVANKTKIIGSWKVLGDTVPPYVPEPTETNGNLPSAAGSTARSTAAAKAFADAEAAMSLRAEPVEHSSSNGYDLSAMDVKSGEPLAPITEISAAGRVPWRREMARRRAWPLRPTVNRIAAAVAVAGLICVWPARTHWDLGIAPEWARAALLLAILQLAYAAWLASIPDRASLWSTMFVLMIVATIYGIAGAVALTTPVDQSPPLGIAESMRSSAPVWCFEIMLISIVIAYVSGHAALRIRGSE
jgi:hypothetical protein